jgi:lipid A 3-O-deacylase
MRHLRLAVIILFLVLTPVICHAFDRTYRYPILETHDSKKLETSENSKAESGANSIWVDGVGGGFQKNTFRIGALIGAGLGAKVLGSEQEHDLALGSANFGWIFTDVMAPGHWYSGNFELMAELFGGGQFHPDAGYFAGLTPFIRYNFATFNRWIPFVEAGAGVSITDISHDLSGRFQFNLQAGGGVNYFYNDRMALTAQYRWLHFSCAGMEKPNNGVNTQMLLIGITWFFK